MTHNINARYEEQEHLFLPPLRTLGFNPQLNINDSLLVQSYIEAYDISYPEALQRIEDEVEELRQHLQNEGSYELNDIGTLALNEDGNYVFTPCEAGILTPALYGLSSVEMNRLDARQAPSQPVAVQTSEPAEEPTAKIVGIDTDTPDTDAEYVEEEEEADVVRIKYTWIRNAVAVAAILIAVFILALPTGKTDMMQRTISNLNNGTRTPAKSKSRRLISRRWSSKIPSLSATRFSVIPSQPLRQNPSRRPRKCARASASSSPATSPRAMPTLLSSASRNRATTRLRSSSATTSAASSTATTPLRTTPTTTSAVSIANPKPQKPG